MAKKPRLLFISGGGPTRIQMAEGFVRYFSGSRVSVESACTGDPKNVHPYCQWAMNEAGIDISVQSPSHLEEKVLASFDHIVTLGLEADRNGLSVPNKAVLEEWHIPDPSSMRTRSSDLIKAFRAVRNEIEESVRTLLVRILST